MSCSTIIRGLISELHEDEPSPLKKRIYLMIRTKQGQERVRHSVYWKPETKELLERKSEELNMSENYLTEICLQKHLPEMRISWS